MNEDNQLKQPLDQAATSAGTDGTAMSGDVIGARDSATEPEAGTARIANSELSDAAERELSARTRRSFLVGGAAALAGFAGWQWLKSRPLEGEIQWPLRRAHQFNERLARAYFSDRRLVATFNGTGREMPRVNGDLGLGGEFDSAAWRLRVTGLAGQRDGEALELTLDDVKSLPRVEYITYLKCIEGWSDVAHFAGARFADFVAKHVSPSPPSAQTSSAPARPDAVSQYVALSTPDGAYYVGLDMASALHPQTLLVYEMGGQPLAPEHGAPLRLYIPVKYGIKSLKRVGTIRFTNERPPDYWAERGYDWHSGH